MHTLRSVVVLLGLGSLFLSACSPPSTPEPQKPPAPQADVPAAAN